MNNRLTQVVWPAPGFPALLGPSQQCVDLVVGGQGLDTPDLSRWAGQFSFRETGTQHRVVGDVVGIERVEDPAADPQIAAFANLPKYQGFDYRRIAIQVSEPLQPRAPRTVALYDLWCGDRLARPRSVACFAGDLRTLNLAFACDLHLAAFWDTIAQAAEQHAPHLAARMLHPQRMWERFVREANALADRGELDLVILGGDLVDHVYRQPRSASSDSNPPTNVHLLADALAPLRVPSLAIPGNHDYRCYPWRSRTYGLAMLGIPWADSKRLLKAAGLWDWGPFSRRDLESLWTEDTAGQPGLTHHLTLLSPATDFAVTLGPLRLVCASTGRDVLPRWREMACSRWGLLLRSLASSWEHPDSEGFSAEQLAWIVSHCSGAQGGALFFHAPLLHTAADVGHDVTPVSLGEEAALEKQLQRAGLRQGVSFGSGVDLLRDLLRLSLPVATFSGHVHHSTSIHIDCHQRLARWAALGPAADPASTLTLFTAPALGHVGRNLQEPPGYLLARFHDGRLVASQVEHFWEHGDSSPQC